MAKQELLLPLRWTGREVPKLFWDPSRSKGAAAGFLSCLLVGGAEQMGKDSLAEPQPHKATSAETKKQK